MSKCWILVPLVLFVSCITTWAILSCKNTDYELVSFVCGQAYWKEIRKKSMAQRTFGIMTCVSIVIVIILGIIIDNQI
jgi:hypothetical protein